MSAAVSHAIVLAAGLGTRMRPLTLEKPKPLIEVAGKTLIDWCLDWLAQAGISEVVVNTSYLAAMLETHVKARRSPSILLSREEPEPLETGGGIAKALAMLGSKPFVALNSDAIFWESKTHPVQQLAHAWNDSAMDFCMALVHRDNTCGWQGNGDFVRDASGRIRRPHAGEQAEYIFTGLELIHPRVFSGCPEGAFSLNVLWKASLNSEGWYSRIHTEIMDGMWLNVGDLNGLQEAERYIKAHA
jgi:MurNAc alpha-1-phosphate uridylyltransferase